MEIHQGQQVQMRSLKYSSYLINYLITIWLINTDVFILNTMKYYKVKYK